MHEWRWWHLPLAGAVWLAVAADAGAACSIQTTPAAFGNYDVFSASADDTTATVSYRCTQVYNLVVITLGRGSSSTFDRTMRSGGEVLSYNLYLNAARTSIWGDGSGGTSTYQRARPPRNQWIAVTAYGRIPAAQDVAVGAYTDTVVATINY